MAKFATMEPFHPYFRDIFRENYRITVANNARGPKLVLFKLETVFQWEKLATVVVNNDRLFKVTSMTIGLWARNLNLKRQMTCKMFFVESTATI